MTAAKRYLLIGIAIYVLGLTAYVVGNYWHEKGRILGDVDRRLRSAAVAMPLVLGKPYLQDMAGKSIDDGKYLEAVRDLSSFAEVNGLKYVYLMSQRDGKIVFVASGATRKELEDGTYSRFGDVYDEASEVLKRVFSARRDAFEEYTDKWGTFRSAFLPWTGSDGQTYVLGADLEISDLNALYNEKVLTSLLTGLLFVLLVSPLFLLNRRMMRAEQLRLEGEVARQTTEIRALNVDLTAKMEETTLEADKARQAMRQAEEARQEAVRARRDGMHEAADQINDVVKALAQASIEMTGEIGQASQGTREQQARVAQTATAMEQMNTSVAGVADNAAQAATGAEDARQRAQDGASVVRQAVDAIRQVQAQTHELKLHMADLGGQAEGIGRIMAVIGDIADQTNLLALNAAIEAARAGDAGRGFAVVADEVRKLAEKTMVATGEVGQSVKAIQQGVRKGVESTDTAATTIQTATELATRSGETLDVIVGLATVTADQVRTIAAAAELQTGSSRQIAQARDGISTISRHNDERMTHVTRAVTAVNEQSDHLGRLVQQMQQG